MSIKNIYPEIASFDGVYQAVHDVNLGATYNPDEISFWDKLENNCHYVANRLEAMDWPPDTYRSFYVYEPKLRKIICCDYVTKVISRAAYNAINPRLIKTFIPRTYACIPGRGGLYAARDLLQALNYWTRKGRKIDYIKGDMTKFFYRIDHEVLMDRTEKKIGDKKVLALLEHYWCDASMAFGLPLGVKNPMLVPDDEMLWDVGISIGGGLSHMGGNIYLDPLDRFVTQELKPLFYTRTMDDFILLEDDRAKSHADLTAIQDFTREELRLQLNEKTCIRPVNQGIEYVGYRIWPGRMELRKSTTLHMKRRLSRTEDLYRDGIITFEKANETVQSYKALLNSTDSKALDAKIWANFRLSHNPKGIYYDTPEEPAGACGTV